MLTRLPPSENTFDQYKRLTSLNREVTFLTEKVIWKKLTNLELEREEKQNYIKFMSSQI